MTARLTIRAWLAAVGAAVDAVNTRMSEPHRGDGERDETQPGAGDEYRPRDLVGDRKPGSRLGIYHFFTPFFVPGSEPGIVVSARTKSLRAHNFLVGRG